MYLVVIQIRQQNLNHKLDAYLHHRELINLLVWGRDFQCFSTSKMRLKPEVKCGNVVSIKSALDYLYTSLARLQFITQIEPKVLALYGATLGQAVCLTSGAQPLKFSLSRATFAHHIAQANEMSEPALHFCQPLAYATTYTWPDLVGCTVYCTGQVQGWQHAEVQCTEKPEQLHGVNISVAQPATDSVGSYLGIRTLLPISNPLSRHSSPHGADDWWCMFEQKFLIKYWHSEQLWTFHLFFFFLILLGFYIAFFFCYFFRNNSIARKKHYWQ